MRYKILYVVLAVVLCSVKMSAQYIPLDYSYCGYCASEQFIPDVRNIIYVAWTAGDCSARIQRAIDYVSSLPIRKDGFRGAILLGEGNFILSEPLQIKASGVVLRGMDKQKTILSKQGVDRGALLYIEGQNDLQVVDTINVASAQVREGSMSLSVSSDKLKRGDFIKIFRPSTKAWIESVGCNIFGGGVDALGWKPGDIDILWDRVVTNVKGKEIFYDAPITATIDSKWGGAKVLVYRWDGRINNCGVENLTLKSTYDKTDPRDEDHCWVGVSMDNVRDCWARRIQFLHFAGNAVILQNTVSRVTVEDCLASEPVSELGGMRRCTFYTRGQQTLIQRCISRNGIHDFAAGFCAPGPNAFVQCEAEETNGYSGSIGSWATGLLFDIVNVDGNNLAYTNLGQSKDGAGWNTANSLFWQCTAAEIECYSPSTDDKNSAYGCWAQYSGNGEWDKSDEHVQPRSIFYAQLSKRLGAASAPNGYVLLRNTDASSSPTIGDAQKMAMEALTRPRLTMEMWQDSVPYTASVSSKGLKNIDKIRVNENPNKVLVHHYEILNGRLIMDHAVLVGNCFEVPWWNGKVKDSFLPHAKPHVTRFVPGREGLGLTDRIDSVIDYMKKNHFLVFDHNYGLWYDLRRDDHERIRRRDGDVWAPFYELPFARSGKGTAWDGLSKYDLTRPNAWYWYRLKTFAEKAEQNGLLLFHENYFQHNIIEAGAHWVDCPWRTVNNINHTGFPEPVPFTGDKRIFMAEYFYNENDSVRRALHRQYIRQCLNNFADNQNVVQLIGAEFTGPLHFVQFWIDVIAEWEHETGKHPLIALSTTKDVQDAILADPVRSKVVDIIDIRYWHYKTDGLYAPPGGKNMSPRQFARKMKVGKIGYFEAYRAVNEYQIKYSDKAVTFFAQNYPSLGWAIFMAGGSCPVLPVTDPQFLSDAAGMKIIDTGTNSYQEMGKIDNGYIIYSHLLQRIVLSHLSGKCQIVRINPSSGEMKYVAKSLEIRDKYELKTETGDAVYWIHRL
jgi:hypothetical protein